MKPESESERRATLARAWDEAAPDYERYFVPRFAPWVAAAVEALPTDLPSGPVLVPCCGTFPEMTALAARHPRRQIVGIDLSAGMVRLARERTATWPWATVEEGDATTLRRRWPGECAGLVSVFGLQQLPDPEAALADWLATLRPGGVLSVVYWPEAVEEDGPFAMVDRVLAPHRPPAGGTWSDLLDDVVRSAGATLLRDEELTHDMSHPDAAAFWDAMAGGGPLRAFANARGDTFMREARAEFLRLAPRGQWRHRPRARWVVARR